MAPLLAAWGPSSVCQGPSPASVRIASLQILGPLSSSAPVETTSKLVSGLWILNRCSTMTEEGEKTCCLLFSAAAALGSGWFSYFRPILFSIVDF